MARVLTQTIIRQKLSRTSINSIYVKSSKNHTYSHILVEFSRIQILMKVYENNGNLTLRL